MDSTDPPSVREDSTLEGHIIKPSSIDESSIKKRDSVYSDKHTEPARASGKALEEAAPAVDESKILHGRKLVLAFVAMMLSVLLIALGSLSYINCCFGCSSSYLRL